MMPAEPVLLAHQRARHHNMIDWFLTRVEAHELATGRRVIEAAADPDEVRELQRSLPVDRWSFRGNPERPSVGVLMVSGVRIVPLHTLLPETWVWRAFHDGVIDTGTATVVGIDRPPREQWAAWCFLLHDQGRHDVADELLSLARMGWQRIDDRDCARMQLELDSLPLRAIRRNHGG
jgi:hypothetical protein